MNDTIEALRAGRLQALLDMHFGCWTWVQVAFGTREEASAYGERPHPDSLAGDVMAAIEERDRLRLRVAELEEKYCNHNVTAILTAGGNNRLRGPA